MTTTPRGRRSRAIGALIACFYAGAFADWWLREKVIMPATREASGFDRTSSSDRASVPAPAHPVATTGQPTAASAPADADAVAALQRRDLRMPIDGAAVDAMKGSFLEQRSGSGGHAHDAVDLLAARNTPIHAVDDGTIAKLFYSQAGGNTIYQFDPSQQFCYYYAHLERYADGLREGQPLTRGDVLGYVGTSGNAPPGTPHLHFAVYELTPERRWWQGRAIDPYLIFRR